MPLQMRKCPPRALIRRGMAFGGPGSTREVQAAGLELLFISQVGNLSATRFNEYFLLRWLRNSALPWPCQAPNGG